MAHNRVAILNGVEEMLIANPQVSLPDISVAQGTERHSIEKIVRELTSLSFREWRREVVMRGAAGILMSSPVRIKKLATAFGYGTTQAFSRSFKNCFGMSPIAYRQSQSLSKVTESSRNVPFSSTNANQLLLHSSAARTRLLVIKSVKFSTRNPES